MPHYTKVMDDFYRYAIALLLAILSGAAVCGQTDHDVRINLDFTVSRASFDDDIVSGDSLHMGYNLAVGYSYFEIGFGHNGTLLWNANMDEDAGFEPEDGFYSDARLFYLRGNLPFNKTMTGFALLGSSKVTVEGTTSYVSCLFFCDDNTLIQTTSETEYNNTESGIAVGIGMQWNTAQNRRVVLQYIDYLYDSDYDFSAIYLSYGVIFRIPTGN